MRCEGVCDGRDQGSRKLRNPAPWQGGRAAWAGGGAANAANSPCAQLTPPRTQLDVLGEGLVELGVVILVLCDLVEQLDRLLHDVLADDLEDLVLLQHLARDVERQVLAVHHACAGSQHEHSARMRTRRGCLPGKREQGPSVDLKRQTRKPASSRTAGRDAANFLGNRAHP